MIYLQVPYIPLTKSQWVKAAKWGISQLGDYWSCHCLAVLAFHKTQNGPHQYLSHSFQPPRNIKLKLGPG